jgi:16S rRNA (uracil1498-N3)-methyltransferase
MQWYYSPDLERDTVQLPEAEAHHLTHVVRAKTGDHIIITDGKGTVVTASLLKINPKECTADVIGRQKDPYPADRLHLAMAPTKNIDRIEWLIEKATEMGVQQFSLLRCRYSERKDVNMERLTRIILSASKQSRRSWFPEINPMQKFSDFISAIQLPAFMAHCNENFIRQDWGSYLKESGKRTILIGPEGDFSEEEIRMADEAGIKGLDLGHRRLRTETAALAVCIPLLINDPVKTR